MIDPELETWVWNPSNRVPKILGWRDGAYQDMKAWLVDQDLWLANSSKPEEPKRAMRAILRKGQRHASSNLFGDLAASVTLRSCRDPAFNELQDTLRFWFPLSHQQSELIRPADRLTATTSNQGRAVRRVPDVGRRGGSVRSRFPLRSIAFPAAARFARRHGRKSGPGR